jgi:hypothetical protein
MLVVGDDRRNVAGRLPATPSGVACVVLDRRRPERRLRPPPVIDPAADEST